MDRWISCWLYFNIRCSFLVGNNEMNIQALNWKSPTTVMGYIVEDTDVNETMRGYGDEIFYKSYPVTIKEYWATGFKWEHPNSGIISGNLDKPMLISTTTTDTEGYELEHETFETDFIKAAKAKLGNISELVWFDFDFEPMDE